MTRRTALLATLLALALPAAARADALAVSLELYGGYAKYDVLGLESGLGGLSDEALLKDANGHLGLLGTLKLGLWEFGALVENGWSGGSSATTTVGGLLGLAFDLGGFRLELLGEGGGRRYGSYLDDAGVPNPPSGAWLPYLGLRPGLAYRFGTALQLLVGVWVFSRWDLATETVPITNPGGGTDVYSLGGATFGASARVGLTF